MLKTNERRVRMSERGTSVVDRLVSWWRLKEARRAATKYGLDLEYRCCFRHQIVGIGEGIKNGSGEIARIPMKSGKTALYKVTSERFNYSSADDTGQRNWHFEFQGYAN